MRVLLIKSFCFGEGYWTLFGSSLMFVNEIMRNIMSSHANQAGGMNKKG